jgi:hypothetical protein
VTELRVQVLDAFYNHQYSTRENEQEEEAEKGGIRASHCRGMIRHAQEFMQKFIDDHPELLVGKLGVGELEVKGDFANNSWGVAEYEESDEEIEDMEGKLQSDEDWAVARAIDDLQDATQQMSVDDSAVEPRCPSASAPLERKFHRLESDSILAMCSDQTLSHIISLCHIIFWYKPYTKILKVCNKPLTVLYLYKS